MNVIQVLFYVLALVLFVLATFGVGARWNLVAAGLASWLIGAAFVPLLS